MEYKKYLVTPEAAAALGVHPVTIPVWCHRHGFGVRMAPTSRWLTPSQRINKAAVRLIDEAASSKTAAIAESTARRQSGSACRHHHF